MINVASQKASEENKPSINDKARHELSEQDLMAFALADSSLGKPLTTLLLERDEQDDTSLKEALGKLKRVALPGTKSINLVGIVSPDTDTVDTWARIHARYAGLAMDDDVENIAERLDNGGMLIVASASDDAATEYLNRKRIQDRIASWDRLEEGISPDQKALQARHQTSKGATTSTAQGRAKSDWNGSLNGGPLKIGGLVNRSPK